MPDSEHAIAETIESLQDREYVVEQPLASVLHVTGRFSNPERIALGAAAQVGDHPVGIWASNQRGDWALVGWQRPELVTITQKGAAPRRWRHRQIPPQMRPDAQTFLEGGASRFDIVTRPKHQPTDAAREVLAGLGIDDPAPPGWEPPVVVAPEPAARVVPVAVKPKRAPRASTPQAPAKPRRPEPAIAVCPTCFMALPATGVCDDCG